MDIDLLSKMVKELILDDDRVVLPGLGCFVAEIVPACFSDKGYTINPPYRKLYFRARPDEGDSLIDFYAKSNSVDHVVAEKIVRDFISELKSVLHVKKTVVFPGLGRLRATKENNIFFVADEDLDIYPEGFGLEPISLKTHTESRTELSAAVASLKTIISDASPLESLVEQAAPQADKRNPENQYEEVKTESETESVPAAPAAESAPETVMEEVQVPVCEPEVDEPVEIGSVEVEPEVDEPVEVEKPSEETSAAGQMKEALQENGHVKKPASMKWVLWVLVILVLILVAYMAAGRLCPELIDRFLYTPEELEILRNF